MKNPVLLNLDDAVLTGCSIHDAGGGLPRRIEQEPMTWSAAIAADNPTSLYWCDETSGAVLVAAVGTDGVIESATFGNAGRDVGTYSLTTLSGRIGYLPTGVFAPANDAPYTLEWSFYGNPFLMVNPGTLLSSLGPDGAQVWGDSGNWYFLVTSGGGNSHYATMASNVYSGGAWHTTTVVYDGAGGLTFYVDGAAISAGVAIMNPTTTFTTGPFYLGGNPNNTYPMYTNFRLDYFAIWNGTALTPQQVLAHHNGGGAAGTARARWTVPQASGSPAMVAVPGALGQTALVKPTRVYVDTGGGPSEVCQSTDLGTLPQTGDTVVEVEMTDATVYIGGDAGEGPTLWVDVDVAAADPVPDAPVASGTFDPVPAPPRAGSATWSP